MVKTAGENSRRPGPTETGGLLSVLDLLGGFWLCRSAVVPATTCCLGCRRGPRGVELGGFLLRLSLLGKERIMVEKKMTLSKSEEDTPLLHDSSGTKEDERQAEKKLVRASLLCAFFMVVELIGGYLSGSLAVMSDAAHLSSDLAGFLISIIAVRLGKLPGDGKMSYGYARAEVIGALVSTLFIWILAAVLFYCAIDRFFHPEVRFTGAQH